jgi:hypothetical protein
MKKVNDDELEGGEEDQQSCSECCATVTGATQKCCARYCNKAMKFLKAKFCKRGRLEHAMKWNFWGSFYYLMSLEICITLGMQYSILGVVDNASDAWGIGLAYYFAITFSIFMILVLGFYFFPNSTERMEKYESKVGALYADFHYKENKYNKLVTVAFILKRVVFTLTCFYAQYWSLLTFQVMTILHLNFMVGL